MTIDEAKAISMQTGKKITHRFFLSDEWIIVLPDNTIITDEGYPPIPWDWFMEDRKSLRWQKDWELKSE